MANTTRYAVRVTENEETYCAALLADSVPRDVMVELVNSLWSNTCADHIDVLDMEWGEIVYKKTWENEEPADIDNDMGFNPYLGCYTDDC